MANPQQILTEYNKLVSSNNKVIQTQWGTIELQESTISNTSNLISKTVIPTKRKRKEIGISTSSQVIFLFQKEGANTKLFVAGHQNSPEEIYTLDPDYEFAIDPTISKTESGYIVNFGIKIKTSAETEETKDVYRLVSIVDNSESLTEKSLTLKEVEKNTATVAGVETQIRYYFRDLNFSNFKNNFFSYVRSSLSTLIFFLTEENRDSKLITKQQGIFLTEYRSSQFGTCVGTHIRTYKISSNLSDEVTILGSFVQVNGVTIDLLLDFDSLNRVYKVDLGEEGGSYTFDPNYDPVLDEINIEAQEGTPVGTGWFIKVDGKFKSLGLSSDNYVSFYDKVFPWLYINNSQSAVYPNDFTGDFSSISLPFCVPPDIRAFNPRSIGSITYAQQYLPFDIDFYGQLPTIFGTSGVVKTLIRVYKNGLFFTEFVGYPVGSISISDPVTIIVGAQPFTRVFINVNDAAVMIAGTVDDEFFIREESREDFPYIANTIGATYSEFPVTVKGQLGSFEEVVNTETSVEVSGFIPYNGEQSYGFAIRIKGVSEITYQGYSTNNDGSFQKIGSFSWLDINGNPLASGSVIFKTFEATDESFPQLTFYGTLFALPPFDNNPRSCHRTVSLDLESADPATLPSVIFLEQEASNSPTEQNLNFQYLPLPSESLEANQVLDGTPRSDLLPYLIGLDRNSALLKEFDSNAEVYKYKFYGVSTSVLLAEDEFKTPSSFEGESYLKNFNILTGDNENVIGKVELIDSSTLARVIKINEDKLSVQVLVARYNNDAFDFTLEEVSMVSEDTWIDPLKELLKISSGEDVTTFRIDASAFLK